MQLSVKPFALLTAKELYEILRVRAAVFVVEQNCVYQDPDGIDQRSIHVFRHENGSVVSYLRIFEKDGDTVQIGRVLTTRRGTGCGRQILEDGIRTAVKQFPGKRIFLEAQCYAVGFYEKAGFRVISEPFPEDGIPHVRMILNISETQT